MTDWLPLLHLNLTNGPIQWENVRRNGFQTTKHNDFRLGVNGNDWRTTSIDEKGQLMRYVIMLDFQLLLVWQSSGTPPARRWKLELRWMAGGISIWFRHGWESNLAHHMEGRTAPLQTRMQHRRLFLWTCEVFCFDSCGCKKTIFSQGAIPNLVTVRRPRPMNYPRQTHQVRQESNVKVHESKKSWILIEWSWPLCRSRLNDENIIHKSYHRATGTAQANCLACKLVPHGENEQRS